MPKKKSDWTPWVKYARELHKREKREDAFKQLVFSIKKLYPKSVQKAIMAALTVAEVTIETKGLLDEDIAFCRFYGHHCVACPAGDKRGACTFPNSDKKGVLEAKKVFAKLYDKIPDRWKKVL